MTRRGPIVVLGEILIDLAADGRDGDGPQRMLAHPGGSPANVAVGLARLGASTAFAGRLASGGFGPTLREHLTVNGVDLSLSVQAQENATLALVTLDAAGAASYTFYGADTADWQWQAAELPDVTAIDAAAVHTGSLALALAPGCSVIAGWLADMKGEVFVSIDPNVRPNFIADLDVYREQLTAVLAGAHLVKVSDEDLKALYPGEQPLQAAHRWAQIGPDLVVVTRGRDGASAISPDGAIVHRAAPPTNVVDTVGAGDAFTAGLLAHLDETTSLRPGGLRELSPEQLGAALDRANLVAARTCERAGADPPRRSARARGHARLASQI